MSKYSIEELVAVLEFLKKRKPLGIKIFDAIIARLRKADKLCEAVKHTDVMACLKFLERINEDGEMRDGQGLLLFPLAQIRNLLRKTLPEPGKEKR